MRCVAFRVDASLLIGTGHVMRCLTLANSLRSSQFECIFICRDFQGNLINLIQQEGFTVHRMQQPSGDIGWSEHLQSDSPHAKWLGLHWRDDADETKSFFSQTVDWLVVDHYALDRNWEGLLRPYCKKIMVIDDLADRPHDCDILLDQTLNREESDCRSLVPAFCKVVCGSRFCLLRPEFSFFREISLKNKKSSRINRILVSMGGVDNENVTALVLNALQFSTLPKSFTITIVLGETSPWITLIKDISAKMHYTTEVLVGVQNMAELMASCDLAIGAAGATSWERCCLGLPCVMLVLAENQIHVAEQLEKAGVVILLQQDADFSLKLNDIIWRLVDLPRKMSEMSYRSRNIVDGYGSVRVIDEMRKFFK